VSNKTFETKMITIKSFYLIETRITSFTAKKAKQKEIIKYKVLPFSFGNVLLLIKFRPLAQWGWQFH